MTTPTVPDTTIPLNEEWRPIAGYEGLYEVSSLGRVRSLDIRVRTYQGTRARRGRLLRFKPRPDGYKTVSLSRDSKVTDFLVHRLVASAFISNPLSHPEVNHRDFDKTNNQASNLEWCNAGMNRVHSAKHGRYGRACTVEKAAAAKRLLAQGAPISLIAKQLGISPKIVAHIRAGTGWAHVDQAAR